MLQSCFSHKLIRVEYDEVKSTKRILQNFHYLGSKEKRTPLYFLNQTILKELKPNNEISYTVYDNLTMSPNAQALENQMFLILGEEIIPIDIEQVDLENTTNITEKRSTILTSDSTSVSVVSGYDQHNRKHYKIKYQLSLQTMDKISQAYEVQFRYYCGPNMMTVILKDKALNRLKDMIVMR